MIGDRFLPKKYEASEFESPVGQLFRIRLVLQFAYAGGA